MSKLNQEKLLEWLEQAHRYFTFEPPGKDDQAYQQIKEMIQKPGVTEKWIEEKAKELITMVSNLYPYEGNPCVIPRNIAWDFIHSLIEEIHGRKKDLV